MGLYRSSNARDRNRARPGLRLAFLNEPRWRRRISLLSAVLATLGLVSLGSVSADADEVDQIVGHGDTASAVTVSWQKGLLAADNRAVVASRDPDSPYSFMHADLENLVVHVSQTEGLVHQAITVSWSGGLPTEDPFKTNFLQMMQCYGDDSSGPDPEGCEFGSAGLLQGSVLNTPIGSREGNLCAATAPSTTEPPRTQDGSGASNGCDPSEPLAPTHIAPCPPTEGCNTGTYSIPFIPAGSTDRHYGTETDFFDQFNTNEVQQANTGADGTGEVSFQTLTSVEAPGLGCGLLGPGGKPRGCWLVIVPRGTYDANGWKATDSTLIAGYVNGSPLGAATWAQRIQIHLGFNNVPSNCAIGSAKERPLIGSELAARAVFSWQVALNAAGKCTTIYGYAATPEPTNTSQFASPDGAGLAFTTIPIGSEAIRSGGPVVPGPPVVYAPMAVSAITFPFHINQSTGLVSTNIKLTPRLLAKALTQSYRFELPDVDSDHPGPDWAKDNPNFITDDPEFQRLNPGINTPPSGTPRAPLLTEDHSAINQQIWSWILADPTARGWLGGQADEHGMVINKNYQDLDLGAAAIDSFPRADPTCFAGVPGARVARCSLDLLPYSHNMDETATRIRAANNPEGAAWDPLKLAPDGQTGWWSNGGIEGAGRIFMWGVTSSADVANLGLVAADLCHADGSDCVSPTAASVSAALAAATPDSNGLLHVNPAAAGQGAYPLVEVTYAAVKVAQSPEALRDYASLILYATSVGQTPGVLPGELPRGYLPLPASLRDQAQVAATKLVAAAVAPSVSPTPATEPPPAALPPPQPPRTPDLPPGTYSTRALIPVTQRFTPATPLGAVRWVLVAIIVVGLFGATGGPVIRGIGRRFASGRRRP